ncbi:unnamed protein product [Eruca vesicaria subsp. sativa]|uniref:Peptidase A1 domain-containing protein n=1 Tax=Eruca vesicaria subsp. sativa TaxID=29727 RepID=A0ABC8KFY9_ERUVS|nr:unnamed protein product [Eruca vesicaria subsp. sativa]
MNSTRNVLNIIIIICICLSWVCTDGAQKRESEQTDSHTIQLSSLFPSSSSPCVLSSRASNTKSSLHVTHRLGTCSSLTSDKATGPDHTEILRLDQGRVNSIHSKLSKKLTDRVRQSKSTALPAKDGSTFGSGNYVVSVGIGTPKRDQSLIFDTGSDLTWIQCQPCVQTCYSQKEPIFNPSSSSSYYNVSCSSAACSSLSSATGNSGSCSASTCVYGIQYGDQSFSVGFLAKEKFTLTTSNVFDGIYFGCGENNQGLFTGVAGLLGLGRDNLSFPSQTATTYNKIFSYCLPSSASYTGHLTFGSTGISRSVKFTPISTITDGTSFYGVDIVAITVGDQKLAIPATVFTTPGALIDSGTVITRLPPKAYAALRNAFKARMSQYPSASGVSILDTCFDLSRFKTVTIPRVVFSFRGGAVVELGSTGVLYAISKSQVCLAFAGNSDDNNAAIFGNVQQQTLEVVYDGAGGRIGFAPNGNLLNIIILLCVYLNRSFTEGAKEKEKYDTKSSLRVVHKHGACSPLRSGEAGRLDHADILRRDKARVNSIHSKLSNHLEDQTYSNDIPVKDESKRKEELGSGSYIVTIGIGTPQHNQPLIVDTGSDLTWTKCRQCGRTISCDSKNKLIFNPFLVYFLRHSIVYISSIHRDCSAPRCCYGIEYKDHSSSDGFLAEDKFTITSADVVARIHFGCSEHDDNINEKTAGLLGLSRHVLSFPSQTASKYHNVFSYCLPSSDRTGHLTFGSTGISESVKFTPIITLQNMPYLYGLDIVGITVGDKKLEIPSIVFSKPRAIIDSGTVVTRLPPKAYAALRSAFKEKMKNYTTTSAVELLDTCYDPKGFDTMAVPKVSFSFGGGTTVELGFNGILYPVNASHVCLAFAGNDNDGEVAIFGSVQQMTLQVVYDKAGGRIGFAQNGCS